MHVLAYQLVLAVLITLATAHWGGLGYTLALALAALQTATLRRAWLKTIQFATLGALAYALWPALDTAPGEPLLSWLSAVLSFGTTAVLVLVLVLLTAVVMPVPASLIRGPRKPPAVRSG